MSELSPVSHGNALSVYFKDPEGNRIELFVDTPWYVEQPVRVPMDMKLSDAEIWAWAERDARSRRASSRWRNGARHLGRNYGDRADLDQELGRGELAHLDQRSTPAAARGRTAGAPC